MNYSTINIPIQGTYHVPEVAIPPVVKIDESDVYNGYIIEPPKPVIDTDNRVGATATLVAGGALTLVGVPLLILPGPGLLTIAGGTMLLRKGMRGIRKHAKKKA
ncbi:MAG: hypothetical protein FWG24_07225 [Eggerthellaceae bacterium]|jgi:hypothetical protein|nr:hypothetical protein [Eggerthellaceae bacterium]